MRTALMPREHGAYGFFALPLATALAIGQPTPAAWLLAGATCCGFIAHEPLAVLFGARGFRRQRQGRRAAWATLALLMLGVVGLGLPGLLRAPIAARVALLGSVLFTALVGYRIMRRGEGHASVQLAAALALSSCAVPVALASGVTLGVALGCALVWGGVFGLAVACVRAVLSQRGTSAGRGRHVVLALALALPSGFLGLVAAGVVARPALIAILPMCVTAAGLVLADVSPRRLRMVGWSVLSASALASLVLVVGLT